MTFTPYAIPQFNSVTDILGYANLYSGNLFTMLMLLVLWVIFFSYFKRYETPTAVSGATAITFMLSVPLALIQFQGASILNPDVPIILLVLTGITGIYLWKSQD